MIQLIASHHGSILSQSSAVPWAPPSSPLAYYTMNTPVSAGGSVPDDSGNGYTGTLVNSAYINDGVMVMTAGTIDRMTVAHNTNFNIQEGTVAMWVYFESLLSAYSALFYRYTIGVYSMTWHGSGTASAPSFTCYNSTSSYTTINGSMVPEQRRWYRVVTSWKAGTYTSRPTMEMWVDGILKSKREDTLNSLTFTTTTGATFFGGFQSNVKLVGMMKEIIIYNRQLTVEEIGVLSACPTPTNTYPA